jgi:hypothetical protein
MLFLLHLFFCSLVDIIGYKGRVNVDKDGNPKIVADGEPSMAPENNTDTFEQAFKNYSILPQSCA